MKSFAALFGTALLVSIASVSYPQSLADLANKEKERRQEVKNDKIITDQQAAKFRSEPLKADGPEQPPGIKPDSEKKSVEDTSASENPESDEPVDFEGRPESYWRKTMAEARQKVKDLENEANVITLRIATLQTQFYAEDDGFKREGIQKEIQKSFYEQDQNKEELAKAQDILQDLEKEARKTGALPGWIQAR